MWLPILVLGGVGLIADFPLWQGACLWIVGGNFRCFCARLTGDRLALHKIIRMLDTTAARAPAGKIRQVVLQFHERSLHVPAVSG